MLTASRSLGFSLRNATARLPPVRTATSAVHRDAGEHLAPELGQIVVHDGDRREAGVDHLEHVVVFEHVGRLVDHDRRLAARFQLLRSGG